VQASSLGTPATGEEVCDDVLVGVGHSVREVGDFRNPHIERLGIVLYPIQWFATLQLLVTLRCVRDYGHLWL
jgi:hypothetical protein